MSRLRRPANFWRREILAGIREFNEQREEVVAPRRGSAPAPVAVRAIPAIRASRTGFISFDGWQIGRIGPPRTGRGATFLLQ